METKELRASASALLDQAQAAIDQGEMETFKRLADEAQATMTKADEIDAAASQVRKLQSAAQHDPGYVQRCRGL